MSGNLSLAARAVAQSGSSAPASFGGHEWLVAINLAFFTAVCIIGAMFAWDQAAHLLRNRLRDFRGHPVTIWRLHGFCLFFAATLRCGVAAAVLWVWNPSEPERTGWVLTLQRYIDPVALTFGLTAMLLFTLSARGMVDQLRREPLAVDMWLSLPMLRRPLLVLALSLGAAFGVVTTR